MWRRVTSCVLLAVLMSAVTLALGVEPRNREMSLWPTHSSRAGSRPEGGFVRDLTIVALDVDDGGHLRLTGARNGTATNRAGIRTQVMQQTITAPATLIDAGGTRDVPFLEMESITPISSGMQLGLALITVDMDDLPNDDEMLVSLLNEGGG